MNRVSFIIKSIARIVHAWRFQCLPLCLCILILGVVQPAFAIEVSKLYEIEIPVESRSNSARREAFQSALQDVLIRVTGNTAITEIEAVDKLLLRASRYVLSYRYIAYSDSSLILEQDSTNQLNNNSVLWIQFDGQAIEHRLQQEKLPVWSSNRPLTLVWLAVQTKSKRLLLSEVEDNFFRMQTKKAAKRRGTPLIFPQLDIEDRQRIDFADIRGKFTSNILQASSRYDSEIILTGIIEEKKESWSAEWTVIRGQTSSGWRIQGDLSSVITSGIDGLTDILVSRYAVSAYAQNMISELSIRVENIKLFADYAKVLNYLSSLPVVDTVKPVMVSGDAVQYVLSIHGEQYHFERAIALQKTLQPITALTVNQDTIFPDNGQQVPVVRTVSLTYRLQD